MRLAGIDVCLLIPLEHPAADSQILSGLTAKQVSDPQVRPVQMIQVFVTHSKSDLPVQ